MKKIILGFAISLISCMYVSVALPATSLQAKTSSCKNFHQYTEIRGEKRFSTGLDYSKQGGDKVQMAEPRRTETGLLIKNIYLSNTGGSLELGIFPKGSQVLLCGIKFQCNCDSIFCSQSIEVAEYNCNVTKGNGSEANPYIVELGKVGSK